MFGKYGVSLFRGIFRGSFSCYDMTMNIMPAAVLSGASIAVNLGAAVYNCLNGGDWSVLAACLLQSFLSLYLTVFVLGVITTITEWDNIYCSATKKVFYAITFPVFMFTYIPIVIVSMFFIFFFKLTNTLQCHPIITKNTFPPSDAQESHITDNLYITYFF